MLDKLQFKGVATKRNAIIRCLSSTMSSIMTRYAISLLHRQFMTRTVYVIITMETMRQMFSCT